MWCSFWKVKNELNPSLCLPFSPLFLSWISCSHLQFSQLEFKVTLCFSLTQILNWIYSDKYDCKSYREVGPGLWHCWWKFLVRAVMTMSGKKKEKWDQFNLSAIDYYVRGFLWNGASRGKKEQLILSNCFSVHNFTLIIEFLEAGSGGGDQLGTQTKHRVEIINKKIQVHSLL